MPRKMTHDERSRLPHGVYRMYDASGALLYVGCSFNVFTRIAGHAEKPWAHAVASIKVQWYDGWHHARVAEADAIENENPMHNKDQPDKTRVGKATLQRAAQKPRGDGLHCPRCGGPKEVVRPGKAYCKKCFNEYQRSRRPMAAAQAAIA